MGNAILTAKPRSGDEIDGIALGVVTKFQPQMLNSLQAFEVQRFFECELWSETGISCDYQQLPFGAYGMTEIDGMRCVICSSLLNNTDGGRFLRSTIGHEIGHCYLHVPEFRLRKLVQFINDSGSTALPRRDEDSVKIYMRPEWQANRFSGALLMPRPSVELAIANGHTAADMCDIFDVHLPFVNSRLRGLKGLKKL